MPLGPFYYDYFRSTPIYEGYYNSTKPEGLPLGELTLSGQTSPKKSHQDEFLEAMGGKKIENSCGEIDISSYIQIDKRIDHEWDVVDRATQTAKQEIQAEEDARVFKMMDDIANPSIEKIEEYKEIINQKTKEAEKLIIQNPDYMVVKRNEPAQEFYSGIWNAEYLELPKSVQEKRAIDQTAVTISEVRPVGEEIALEQPGEYVLTFDPVTSEWSSKKVEEKPKFFDSKGEVSATSLKDALQTLIKYAEILEKEEIKDVVALQKMQDNFAGGEALKHSIEKSIYFEPSYVTGGADPSAKVKQIIDSATKDELITRAINSAEGKKALAQAMAEPLRRNLNYHEIARAAFPIEQMGAAPSSLTYERTDRSQIMGSSDINELRQTITNIGGSLELKDKKKRRRRHKMVPVNPLFLFTLAAAGAGMAHATKPKVSNEDIKVRQINE